jgi:hypothetical protein
VEAIPDKTTLALDPNFTVDFIVEIYDLSKLKLGEAVSKDNKVSIILGIVKKGLYFVHITDKSGTIKKPLLIE